LRLSSVGLQASDAIKAQPEDLVNAITNLKGQVQVMREALKGYGKQALRRMEPEKMEGFRVYCGAFEGLDKKTLVDAANDLVRYDRSAVVLATLDERLTLIVATSKDLDVDCREVLTDGLKVAGGKGGGGRNFASGGAISTQRAAEVIDAARSSLMSRLSCK
jgi:alanyl-tRNA synthetase